MTDELPESLTNGIRDDRLIRRAIKERWDIPETHRKAIIARQVRIAAGLVQGTSAREETAAFSAILEAEAQNQKDEHKVVDVRVATRNDELAGIATDLGIEVSLVEDASRKANCGSGGVEGKSTEIMERSG